MVPHESHKHERPGAAEQPGTPTAYTLDRAGVREVDRIATEQYGIPGIVLMENAARALTEQAVRMVGSERIGRVLIVCGAGNNGGDGWALARHLANRGLVPIVTSLGEPRPESDAGANRAVCARMSIAESPVADLDRHRDAALIVDAMFGTGLARPIGGDAAAVIAWINASEIPVLAVDVPSGLDCDTGRPLGPCVRATVTVTFVGLKTGFGAMEAQPFVGEVVVGDIGVPRELVERFGRARPAGPSAQHQRAD